MPSNTTYYNLWIFDPSTDIGSTFLTFRSDIAGTAGNSNFVLIDAALHTHDTQITALQSVKGIIYVPLIFQSANFFTATGISGIASYTDGLIIDAALNQDCTGTVTVNINSLGTKSLLKYNSTGSSTINLSSGDMKANKEYLFRYSSIAGAFIWVNSTAGDQVNVVGTSGNFVSLTSTGVLQDSTIANSSLAHLSGTETLTGAKTFNLPPNYVTQSISTTATLSSASAPIVLIDTTSAGFTLQLPSSPITGEWFRMIDNTSQWATHNLTISPNGKNIDGSSSNVVLNTAGANYEVYYDGTQWHRVSGNNLATTSFRGYSPALSGTAQNTLLGSGAWGVVGGPQSYATNYKIVPSVTSNNLTVALKGLDGNDPSATNPVYVRVGDTLRSITSALSKTTNAGANWFNAGGAELATKEIDYFVYLGFNATDGVTMGFTRIAYAHQFSDFNTVTATNERYCAISTITNAVSTDYYEIIGRFAATLSAGAGYTWSVPTYTPINLINRPIYRTRELVFAPVHTRTGTNYTTPPTVVSAIYMVVEEKCKILERHSQAATPGGTGNQNMTLPFANNNAFATTLPVSNITDAIMLVLFVLLSVNNGNIWKYDGTVDATGSKTYVVEGEYWIG